MRKWSLMVLVVLLSLSMLLVACAESTQTSDGESNDGNNTGGNQEAEELSVNAPDGDVLSTGPNGETAVSANTLKLTAEEVQQIRDGNYTAAIVMHYVGNDWSRAQIQGLEDTFGSLGIEIVAITDANFKAEKQVSDIETVLVKDPDIIISIPVDATSTSSAYKKAAESGAKLVFMDNLPANMERDEYVSVVSADNYGNGVISARIMGDSLGGVGKVGVVYHDADYFSTQQRTEAFEKTLKEEFPDIEIAARGGFTDPNDGEGVASAMLTSNPDLDGIYGAWDVPAEGILSAARAMGRDDLVITTIDLGVNVAVNIAQGGMIKGLGAQLPYHQGVSEAILGAYSLLGKETETYVALPPLKVTKENLLEAWKTVYVEEAPQEVQDSMN